MRVSIVIPAHNASKTLRECLCACMNQTHSDCDITVVDDGSEDDTAAIARELSVALIQQDRRGPAAARNAGARAANGAIVAFTDSDCVPHADWIAQLLSGFTENAGAVGGTYGIANPDSALARLVHAEIQLRHAAYGERIDFAGSYNLAMDRELFLSLDGFDEHFRAASAEDNDLCYRLLDSGRAIHFVRDAIVDHHHPTWLWPYLMTQARHGFWRAKLYAKHPGRKTGDRYAGGLELWLPLVAVGTVVASVVQLVFLSLYLNLMIVFLLSLWFLYRAVSAVRIARLDPTLPILFSSMALVLRDFARGIGIVRGVWHFLVLRKETA